MSGCRTRNGRAPDLFVLNKSDLGGDALGSAADCRVSASTGEGIPELVSRVKDLVVPPADLEASRPWIFNDRLYADFMAKVAETSSG